MMNWDPFREMVSLREAMDRLFEESFVRPRATRMNGGRRPIYLPVDAYVTDDEVVVHAWVPGVSPKDVNITIEDNILTISGEIPAPAENVDWVIQETAYGPFRRTLTLNVPVNADDAEAIFENGRLTLHLPKAEEVRPKQIKVKAK
ncbi:MAG: Hsp20/alpha crystallin family protein [Chloroflexi bacterium]|nr:MAG: Hsp20/alpha crystallin family protein [Chloroflexota bacterium]